MGDRRRADFSLRQLQAVYHLPLRDVRRSLSAVNDLVDALTALVP